MIKQIKKLFESKSRSLISFAQSHQGPRQENQDNYLIIQKEKNQVIARYLNDEKPISQPLPDWPDNMIRIAVADGMGGHANGRQIAEQLVSELLQLPPQYTPEAMKQHIIDIHHRLFDTFNLNHDDKSPGTTLVMADIHRQTGQAVLINVGDSRAYLIQPRRFRKKLPVIHQLTKDHSFAEFAWRDGEIDQTTYNNNLNVQHSRLAQAVGFGSRGLLKDEEGFKPFQPDKGLRIDLANDLSTKLKSHADAFQITIKSNDILMLSSDGLWSGESTGQWFNDHPFYDVTQALLTQLIDIAIHRNATDNITVAMSGFQNDE